MSETITQAEKQLISDITAEYMGLMCTKINKEEAEKGVDFLYTIAGFKAPKKVFVDSPLGAQYLYNMIVMAIDNDAEIASYSKQQTSNGGDTVWESALASFLTAFGEDIQGLEFEHENYLRDKCYLNLDKHVSSSWNGNISDAGYCAYYDFYIKTGTIETTENFEKMKQYLRSGIYDCIQMADICIVISHPEEYHTDKSEDNKLHHESHYAIKFADGFQPCYWHGQKVPSKWIYFPEEVTKGDINEIENVELKRALMEILGEKRFFELLDLEVIDESTDRSGRMLNLYKTKEIDSLAEEYIYFLKMIDHSTSREYVICVEGTSGNARTELAKSYSFDTWEEYIFEVES